MKARSLLACSRWEYARRPQYVTRIVLALICCCLIIVASSCAKVPSKKGPAQAFTPIANSTAIASPTPTPKPPTIALQVIGCPSGLSINWDNLVGTKVNVNKVQKVTCGSLEGSGSFEALINVRYYTPDAKLDYYVYNNLYGTPDRTFNMQGLLDGDAQISPSGTIMTAEIGPQDTIKAKPDVFKEYQWNGSAFVQAMFPGMYPDMTYYQAEQNQAQLNTELAAGNKQDEWRIQFFGVPDHLARVIFHWTNINTRTIRFRSNSGTYIVAVYNLGPGGGGFIANMFHLDYNSANTFEIMQLTSIDGSVLLSAPTTGVQLGNPLTVSGSSYANGTVLGKVVVYNDTLIDIGDSGDIRSPAAAGYVNFTKSINYHLNSSGVQEAVVAFYWTNQNNSNFTNQVVIVKVLLVA
ncbi:MAG TPA: hypothetical protein VIX20_07295 [Ktedonobacteraceae bacterium]